MEYLDMASGHHCCIVCMSRRRRSSILCNLSKEQTAAGPESEESKVSVELDCQPWRVLGVWNGRGSSVAPQCCGAEGLYLQTCASQGTVGL